VVRTDADRLCSTGSPRRGSPVSTLICSPPTSHHPSASAPFPVAFGLPRPHLLFLSGLRVQMKHSTPSEAGHRPSASPDFHRGGGGISRVTGPSSSCAPWSNTPPDALRPRPFAVPALLPSGGLLPWASENCHFVAASPRLTRSRAYASPTPLPTSAQGSLPTCRARLWSDGFRTRWTTHPDFQKISPPFFPRDRHCSVAPDPIT